MKRLTKIILCLAILMSAFLVNEADAATFRVTRSDDRNSTTVNCPASPTSDCSLREALTIANATAGADTLQFNANLTVTLTLGELVLSDSVTIDGNNSTVQRSSAGGTPLFRVFFVNSGVTATFNNLVVSNGNSNDFIGGGGIRNEGVLTINNSTVTNNRATNGGSGGGILNRVGATLTLNNSTIRNNTIPLFINSSGGGICNLGTAFLNNSTINGNSTAGSGGGIFNAGVANYTQLTIAGNTAAAGGGIFFNGGNLLLTNCTITGNNATGGDGGGLGGNFGGINYRNTIVAGNTGANSPDLTSGHISYGNNLIGSTLGSTNTFQTSDILNPPTAGLGVLGNNGGATQTVQLLPASPAINAGTNCVTNLSCSFPNALFALTTDQRGAGFPRQVGAAVDIGAFESSIATAAGVFIGGRVLDASGQAVSRAVVTLTDAGGVIRTTRTNSFGFYRFEDTAAGATYIVAVNHKALTFAPRVVSVADDVSDLDFTAQDAGI